MFDKITNELEIFYQSKAMTDHPPTLTVTHRSVIASCFACLLLMLPSFASAQGDLGTLDQGGETLDQGSEMLDQGSETLEQGSGSKADAPVEPAAEAPPVVITPGAQSEQPSTPETEGAAGDAAVAADGTDQSSDNPEAELTNEEKRAAWMAELEQLTFKELVKRIRDDEQEINKLYIGIPIDDPERQLIFERRIAFLQQEVSVLNQLLEPAAVEAFRSNPMESKAATDKVFEVLESKLAPKGRQAKYDPGGALKLVNTILEIKGGHVGMEPGVKPLPEDEPFMRIIFQGYLASYGLQDFRSANEFLTRLENLNIGLDPKLRQDFDLTVQAWEIEKALRAQEEAANNLPRVKLETTDGDVVIELFEDQAPNTVANFIKLVKDGFYDNLEFFHVVPSSYARAGCTANDGTTNPGYRIRNEFEDERRHFAGTVVMQNDGENTAGSQFIILHRPDPNLAGKVVAFGRVLEGLDIVYGFKPVNRIRNPNGKATVINKATVLRDRGHEYEPEIIEDAAGLLRESGVLPSRRKTAGPSTRGSSAGRLTTGGSTNQIPATGGFSTGGSSTRGPSTSGSSNRLQP